ncbi:MAG: phosphonate ABC transporter ATP-binding protein [Bellilinea sp.]|nr:MAG: phosphonate ABC transporter ATP-binding protein [Bellilinea sp.]
MEDLSISELIRSKLLQSGNPVILDDTVYLCWLGDHPPGIICDLNNWDEEHPFQFKHLAGDLWVYPLDLPRGTYLEYAFIRHKRRIHDPHNSHRTPNGMGKYNHQFTFPASDLAFNLPKEPPRLKGKLITLRLPTHQLLAGKKRNVHLYQPPVLDPVPLLVMWDGKEYLERAMLPHLVEDFVEQGKIEPIALALIENGGRYRAMEYSCSEATLGFLQFSVLPTTLQHLNIISPHEKLGSLAIGGASLGGLMALYAALRMPHWFGKVLSQSGAFTIRDQKLVVWSLIEHQQTLPLKLWLDCGIYEPLIETNREMVTLLQKKGYTFTYKESNSGHNYPAWRRLLPDALITLFGR